MKKEDAKKLPKYKVNPVLEGLPEYLKDPKNYRKIRKALLEELASSHSHSDILEWSGCFNCQQKAMNQEAMKRKLGFKSPAQYLAWRKIMEKIEEIQKVKLAKYND